jgi:hypothetical protein
MEVALLIYHAVLAAITLVSLIVFALTCVLIVGFVLAVSSLKSIPGPPAKFIIGNLDLMSGDGGKPRMFRSVHMDLAEKYGSVHKLIFGSYAIVGITGNTKAKTCSLCVGFDFQTELNAFRHSLW